MFKYLATAAIIGLSACQSTLEPDVSSNFAPASVTTAGDTGGTQYSYDEATQTVTNGTSTIALAGKTSNGLGYALDRRGNRGSEWLIATETRSGQGSVVGWRNGNEPAIRLERRSSVEIPTSGTAQFFADYAGISSTSYGNVRIVGDAVLNADFDAATISGAIVNRSSDGGRAGLYSDVDFGTAAITDGNFSGITSGGEHYYYRNRGEAIATGSYVGKIVGPNASEVIGGVHIDHARYTENGVFATQ